MAQGFSKFFIVEILRNNFDISIKQAWNLKKNMLITQTIHSILFIYSVLFIQFEIKKFSIKLYNKMDAFPFPKGKMPYFWTFHEMFCSTYWSNNITTLQAYPKLDEKNEQKRKEDENFAQHTTYIIFKLLGSSLPFHQIFWIHLQTNRSKNFAGIRCAWPGSFVVTLNFKLNECR